MQIFEALFSIGNWSNNNQGVITIIIFVMTVFIGWISGIFSALRRRPKFNIEILQGPTFFCTFKTGQFFGDFEEHQTGIAVYLQVSNIGSAASSIHGIHIGYHWNVHPFCRAGFLYRLGWFWIKDQYVILDDFQISIGDRTKVYPFLTQKSKYSSKSKTFLDVGRSTNGVVYFEQARSWGGCSPLVASGKSKFRIRIYDVFEGCHEKVVKLDSVDLNHALSYNPSFGATHSALGRVDEVEEQAEPEYII